jgi:hypothetical protein
MSAAGVGDDGWTTYIGTRVISVEVLGGSTMTDSPPITITGAPPANALVSLNPLLTVSCSRDDRRGRLRLPRE